MDTQCSTVIRSFDINKPDAEIDELKRGVADGSILTGVLRVGQEVEIHHNEKHSRAEPMQADFQQDLHSENNHLQFAVPGGLIGVGTKIDPMPCRADRLVIK